MKRKLDPFYLFSLESDSKNNIKLNFKKVIITIQLVNKS